MSKKSTKWIGRGRNVLFRDFTNNEAILGRCSFDFDDEGDKVELEIESVKRV